MRKIIQLMEDNASDMRALCDDGTIWGWGDGKWNLHYREVPQGPIKTEEKESTKEITLKEINAVLYAHIKWMDGLQGQKMALSGVAKGEEDELMEAIVVNSAYILGNKKIAF